MKRVAAIAVTVAVVLAAADFSDHLGPSLDHPTIRYRSGELSDPVTLLASKLKKGEARLEFEGRQGYLRSLLSALQVPIESQILVYSKSSLQTPLIEPRNPRAIFFNDTLAVAWMPGGFIEIASQDPQRGVIFYALRQEQQSTPTLQRRFDCLSCHVSEASVGVPGMMVRSLFTGADGSLRLILGSSLVDHRTPTAERWGGFYVTGVESGLKHLGNTFATPDSEPASLATDATRRVASLAGRFDEQNYFSPYSDVGALLLFDHQMHMMNLITRVGWEVRAAQYEAKLGHDVDLPKVLQEAAQELTDYLLFVEEAPLTNGAGRLASRFAAKFAAQGPRDRKGRSLRDLDLRSRLMRYPCSYIIGSAAFQALPEEAKAAIYHRMWGILSGAEAGAKYARLTAADRRAAIEILSDTQPDLPAYFKP